MTRQRKNFKNLLVKNVWPDLKTMSFLGEQTRALLFPILTGQTLGQGGTLDPCPGPGEGQSK